MKEAATILLEETRGLETEEFLKYIVDKFQNRVALASSFSIEDQVVTDILCKITDKPNIFTLDTGRLPQATYNAIDATRDKYSLKIKIRFPDTTQVEEMINAKGTNSFYENIENRKECCRIRKVLPLQKQLAALDAWITGLRREQAVIRETLERVEFDTDNNLVKINPLAEWSTQETWNYIKINNIPYNNLYDRRYPSIGCEPCTRAVAGDQDIRSGRWWWESPEQKECGLHMINNQLTRNK